MPVVANKAKKRQFSDLPVKTQQRIVDFLDPISKCRLRRVSKAFLALSNNSKINFFSVEIEVSNSKVRIVAGKCDIEYIDNTNTEEDGHHFRTKKTRNQPRKLLPLLSGLFMNAAAKAVFYILNSPNVSMLQLSMEFKETYNTPAPRLYPQELKATREIEKAFMRLGRKVPVRLLHLRFSTWGIKAPEILTILGAMQPGNLGAIFIIGVGKDAYLDRKMVLTEQWKQADDLFFDMSDSLRVKHLLHFRTLYLRADYLSFDTFEDFIQMCIQNPKFRKLTLHYKSAGYLEVYEPDIVSYLAQFPTKKPDTEWRYIPIPGKKDERLKVSHTAKMLDVIRVKR